MVITTMYAVLFATLRANGVRPTAFAVIALFFTAVGLGQMLLFRGRRPRRASILVGACANPLLIIGGAIVDSFTRGQPIDHFSAVFGGLLCGLPSGALFGYLAGGLIAGVFLLIDRLPAAYMNTTHNEPPDPMDDDETVRLQGPSET